MSLARTFPSLRPVSPAAAHVIELLQGYTAFPAALLATVCERHGMDVASLSAAEVPELIQPIALQVALFNHVDAGFAVKRRLLLGLHGV